jgi:hypothetical protein
VERRSTVLGAEAYYRRRPRCQPRVGTHVAARCSCMRMSKRRRRCLLSTRYRRVVPSSVCTFLYSKHCLTPWDLPGQACAPPCRFESTCIIVCVARLNGTHDRAFCAHTCPTPAAEVTFTFFCLTVSSGGTDTSCCRHMHRVYGDGSPCLTKLLFREVDLPINSHHSLGSSLGATWCTGQITRDFTAELEPFIIAIATLSSQL